MAIERPLPHEDAASFANMVTYTARVESLRADLVEKDYFCTLILANLCAPDAALVFKGGTCLAKVRSGRVAPVLRSQVPFLAGRDAGS